MFARSRAFQSAREGRGQFVTVSGHAGVGKSRLLYEFRRRVESSAIVLASRCEAYGRIAPYQAFFHPMRQALGLLETRAEPSDEVLLANATALGVEGLSLSYSVIGELYMSLGFIGIALGGWFYGRISSMASALLTRCTTQGALARC